jgi:hypothetical protein
MEDIYKMGHIMLDLETMGTDNDSVICSIGAVEFDINTGATGREFYAKIDIQSCLDIGLKVTGSTILFWMKQSEEARRELYDAKGEQINSVLMKFSEFVNLVGNDCQIWGNSNRFDMGILQTAYTKCYYKIPWDFRKERDVRTLVSFRPEIQKNYPSYGVAHSPVDDCKYQIGYSSMIWNDINAATKQTHVVDTTKLDIDESRRIIMELMEQYKADVLFDRRWLIEHILLPETN